MSEFRDAIVSCRAVFIPSLCTVISCIQYECFSWGCQTSKEILVCELKLNTLFLLYPCIPFKVDDLYCQIF